VPDQLLREHNVLRIPACSKKIGLKRSAIYDKLTPKSPRYDPTFPRPIRLGARAVGFLEAELDTWLDARIAASRKVAT
jgi:prophage regulatory protein